MEYYIIPLKTCTKCNRVLPATPFFFYRKKSGKQGLTPRCKNCILADVHEYQEKNPEKIKQKNSRYYQENREQLIEKMAQYRDENRDAIKAQQKQYHEENKEWRNERSRQYYRENKEQIAETNRQYRETRKEETREYNRKYYQENKEQISEQGKLYRQDPEVKKQKREYMRKWTARNREKVNQHSREQYKKHRNRKMATAKRYYGLNKGKFRVYALNRRARKRALPDTFTTDQWLSCLEYFHHCCAVCGKQLRDLFGYIQPNADHWIPVSYEGDDNPGTVAENMVCLCEFCNKSKAASMPEAWLKETYNARKANEILARIQAYFNSLSA